MIAWWNEMTLVQQIFALIAIPSTLIMLIQAILLIVGVGGGEDIDLDGDGDPDVEIDGDSGFALFSVRGVVSALAVMGWVAVALIDDMNDVLAIIIAVVAGLLTLIGTALLMRTFSRLQYSGNVDVENAVGKVGQVYIPIPAEAHGTGKVTITLQEQYVELDALTNAKEKLTTGTYVRVVAVDEARTLVVEPIGGNGK